MSINGHTRSLPIVSGLFCSNRQEGVEELLSCFILVVSVVFLIGFRRKYEGLSNEGVDNVGALGSAASIDM